uniref:DUF7138 domain-containing protein n=1 Tax=Leersia perrieri TaxID=77586 RepID=A0A0D9WBE8_9ORYZ
MGELASSPVVFIDGEQSVDLGTVTVQPSLGVRKLQAVERTILKRLPATDLASLASSPSPTAMFGVWDYEAQLQELQRQREWYLMHTAAADPYFPPPEREDPPLWSSARPLMPPRSSCPECEAAAASMREPGFHWCVRDAVTVGFRSPVGPIERPAKKSPSPSPSPPLPPSLAPPFVGIGMMPVY